MFGGRAPATVCAVLLCAVFFLFSNEAAAVLPLITDDTGTQGERKFQLELNGQYVHDTDRGVIERFAQAGATVTYGIVNTVDVILGVPYQHVRIESSGMTTTGNGIADSLMELKWRFFEKEGLSFAVKPSFTFPTGNEEKGLGVGRTTYGFFFIATTEREACAFHLNLAYRRNENKVDERRNIFHSSLASELKVAKNIRIVGDVGIETNRPKDATTPPAFALVGIVYSLGEGIDIDAGFKRGITRTEPDYALSTGLTLRF